MTFYFGDCRIVIILLWGPQIRFGHRDRFHVLELGCQKERAMVFTSYN